MTDTELTNLKTARANFAAKLAEVSANPLPSYTVGNTTMNFVEYYRFLSEEFAKLDLMVEAEESDADAWEVTSEGCV